MRERCCSTCNFTLADVFAANSRAAEIGAAGAIGLTTQRLVPTKYQEADLAALSPYLMSKRIAVRGPHIVQNGTMIDNSAFLFSHPQSNRTAILCLHTKAGSTTWLRALLRVLGIQTHHVHEMAAKPLNSFMKLPIQPLNALLRDPHIPRIMLVRNPYSRLLSGYLDKMAINSSAGGFDLWEFERMKPRHGWFKLGDSFASFVQAILNADKPNRHFELQSEHCGLPNGLLWDYALHLEDVTVWHGPLARLLQLNPRVLPGNMHTMADAKLQAHYTMPLARLVSAWAHAELAVFKYAPWNGSGPLPQNSV